MATDQNEDRLGDKKWNSEQNPNLDHKEHNEGFSSENIPADYNPGPLKTEQEINERGEKSTVERARHEDASVNHEQQEYEKRGEIGNSEIENSKSFENKDRNYDTEDNRYPASHPENHRNRGSIDLDKQ